MKILFGAYFHQKNFGNKVGRKFIKVKLPDPEVFDSRIRIWSKSLGSATLPDTHQNCLSPQHRAHIAGHLKPEVKP
jgi:hypothetical protein